MKALPIGVGGMSEGKRRKESWKWRNRVEKVEVGARQPRGYPRLLNMLAPVLCFVIGEQATAINHSLCLPAEDL